MWLLQEVLINQRVTGKTILTNQHATTKQAVGRVFVPASQNNPETSCDNQRGAHE